MFSRVSPDLDLVFTSVLVYKGGKGKVGFVFVALTECIKRGDVIPTVTPRLSINLSYLVLVGFVMSVKSVPRVAHIISYRDKQRICSFAR